MAGIRAVLFGAVLTAPLSWAAGRKTGQSRLLWLALSFFAAAGGLAYVRGLERVPLCPEEWDGAPAEVSGRILRMELRDDGTRLWLGDCKVRLLSEELPRETKSLPGLLLFLDEPLKGAAEGRRIHTRGELGALSPAANPGTFDGASYYRALGVSAMAYGQGGAAFTGRADLFRKTLRELRGWLSDGISRAALTFEGGEEDAGLLSAMLLGEKWSAPEELEKLYEDSGIAHLLAISGLHISMAGMGLFRLLRNRLRASYPLCALACAGAAFSCYVMTGEGSSAARSFLMLSVYGAGQALGKEYDSPSSAALATLISLAKNPLLLFQCGFQLSYGCVLALGLLAPLLEGKKKGLRARLIRPFLPGTAILLATLPIQAYFFGKLPVYSLLLNILLIPLFLPLAAFGLLCGVLGNLSEAAAVFSFLPAKTILWLYENLSRASLALPGAVWRMGRPEPFQLAACVLFLGLLCRLLRLEKRRGAALCAALLFASLLPVSLLPWGRRLKLVFLDVGQGDCCFMRTPGGTTFLIDGGSSDERETGTWTIGPFLDSQAVGRVDFALISHGDSDHVNGIRELMEEGRVARLVLPGLKKRDQGLLELEKLAGELEIPVSFLSQGDRLKAGEVTLSCLWPGTEDKAGDANASSMVLWCSFGAFDALFTGDLEGVGEEGLLEYMESRFSHGDLEILKVPHHGSESACTEALLLEAAPRLAVISCGKDNPYGHPAPALLKRLEKAGCALHRTDEVGALSVSTDGKTMELRPFLRKEKQ